jgi:hypothetical protein
MALELKSGHAPGKDGVGERATIEKEKERHEGSFWGKVRKRMTLFHWGITIT